MGQLSGQPNPLPYDPSHRYEETITATRSTKLFVYVASGQLDDSVTGSFTVEIWGPPPAPAAPAAPAPSNASPTLAPRPHGRPARVRRVRSCPARNRLSARAAAAAKCVWYVSFEVTQRGLPIPIRGGPALPGDLAAIDTLAYGAVFFNRKPRPGVRAIGSSSGVMGVRHDYISPGLVQREFQTYLELGRRAAYRYRSPGERTLTLEFKVSTSTFPECLTADDTGQGSPGAGYGARGSAAVLVDDVSPDNNDRLGFGGGETCGLNASFARTSTNKMRVQISKPRLVRR